MQTQCQQGGYIHSYTNETHSLTNIQDLNLTYFGSNNYRQHKLTKVGMYHSLCMHVPQLELCGHEQTQIVAIAACRVLY